MDEITTAREHLTVAQAARLAGVTVRTLHHYDNIGLLTPSQRSDADYRRYGSADITRLREILVWRRLGVSLAEIRRLLDDPTIDRLDVLRRQRALIDTQRTALDALAHALEDAIERATTNGDTMQTDPEILAALDGFDPVDHADEAHARWGDTDAYRESTRRAASYSPADWAAIKAEADENLARLITAFESGAAATDDVAVEQAEAFRAHIERWFYTCPPQFLRSLGDMYVADPRFRASYDGVDGQRPGMAEWVRDAWHARADRG